MPACSSMRAKLCYERGPLQSPATLCLDRLTKPPSAAGVLVVPVRWLDKAKRRAARALFSAQLQACQLVMCWPVERRPATLRPAGAAEPSLSSWRAGAG